MGNANSILGDCQGALPASLTAGLTALDEPSFDDTYEADEEASLGRGKFGQVYMCWLKKTPWQRYALKAIETRNSDMASMDRIRDEISILRLLGAHKGLVSCVDVDESLPGTIRLVMELCEGGELYDRIQIKKRYQEQEAKIVCANLLEALAFVHSKGIMHRDLKPENILLCSRHSDTDVKISDFGLAKFARNFPERLPRSNSICGSDFYLAPEIIKQDEYGREVDIWALGVVSFVLLSGSLPFYNEVLHKLYRQIVEREMNFNSEAWKGVSKGAMDFILRMLQVQVGERLSADQARLHPWLRVTMPHGFSFSAVDEAQAIMSLSRESTSKQQQRVTQPAFLTPSNYLRSGPLHDQPGGQAAAMFGFGATAPAAPPPQLGSLPWKASLPSMQPGSHAMAPGRGAHRGRFAGA